jgi:hypothetical protein
MVDMSNYISEAYCGRSIWSAIWRTLNNIYFNVFIKRRNPLTPITIYDLHLKPEEEEDLKNELKEELEKLRAQIHLKI